MELLKLGGRWIDASPDYGPRKTLYNRYVRWAAKGVWSPLFNALANAGGPPAQVPIDSSAVKAHRSASGGKGGEQNQAIGRSRGGRTTKIHALTDRHCRPIAFLLTGGQVADCTAAATLLKQMPPARIVHGDKGYDSNAVRHQVEENGTMPNIPPKANRRWKLCFSRVLYRDRNAIERMFCRLKDFRRFATRYDRRRRLPRRRRIRILAQLSPDPSTTLAESNWRSPDGPSAVGACWRCGCPGDGAEDGSADLRQWRPRRAAPRAFFLRWPVPYTGAGGRHRRSWSSRMAVEAAPGAALEVVEAEFLLHLLMGLLAQAA